MKSEFIEIVLSDEDQKVLSKKLFGDRNYSDVEVFENEEDFYDESKDYELYFYKNHDIR